MAHDPDFKWDPDDPLLRVERESWQGKRAGESLNEYRALLDYYGMGPGRTIEKLHQKYLEEAAAGIQVPTTSLASLKSWCMYYCWVHRVADRVQADQKLMTKALIERRVRAVMSDWEHGERLRDLAAKILDAAPAFTRKHTKVVSPGKPMIIDQDGTVISKGEPRETVTTVAMNSNDLAKISKLASDLQRAATGMDGKGAVQTTLNIDFESLSEAQLERIVRGENVLDVLAEQRLGGS